MNYKIIEIIDGECNSIFKVKKKFTLKFWLNIYSPHWSENHFRTIEDATKEIEKCIDINLKNTKKIISHNIKRTNIPEHIPAEQHAKWLTMEETK